MTMLSRGTSLAVALLLCGGAAHAAVPQRLNYQGKLANAAGDPLTGTYSFRFKLFAAETGGAALFSEDVTGADAIPVVNGIYTVQVGSYTAGGIPYGVFDGQDLYLELDVNAGPTLTGAETLSPRERLNASPWALHALGAERLGTGTVVSTHTAQGDLLVARNIYASSGTLAGGYFSVGGSTFVVMDGSVGIGTALPKDALHVYRNYNSLGSRNLNSATILIDGAAGNDAWLGWGIGGVTSFTAGFDDGNKRLDFWGHNDTSWNHALTMTTTGQIGVGTISPATRLDVGGDAQFGSGATKSTFTAAGSLVMASGATITGGGVVVNPMTSTLNLNGPGADLGTSTQEGVSVSTHLFMVSGSSVGIGTQSPSSPLQLERVFRTTGGEGSGAQFLVYAQPGAASSLDLGAVKMQAFAQGGAADMSGAQVAAFKGQAFRQMTGTVGSVVGGYNQVFNQDTGTLGSAYGFFGEVLNQAAGTVSNANAVYGKVQNTSPGTITNANMLFAANPVNSGGGAITNVNGLYIESLTAGTNRNAILYDNPSSRFVVGGSGWLGLGADWPSGLLHVSTGTGAANLFVDATSGNVGVGTTNPGRTSGGSSFGQLDLYHATGGSAGIRWGTGQNGYNEWVASARAYADSGAWGQGRLTFQTAGATGAVIDTLTLKGGNVGVGTTGPNTMLTVGTFTYTGGDYPGVNPSNILNVNSPNPTTSAYQGYQLTLTETGAVGIDKGGTIGFQAVYDGSNNVATIAGIKGLRSNATAGDFSGYLSFLTRASPGPPAERVRIDSAGNVGIETTLPKDALHVYRNYNSLGSRNLNSATILIDGAAGNDAWLGWGIGGVTSFTAGFDDGNKRLDFWGHNDTSWNHALTMTTTGQIGIGTTNPGARLAVQVPGDTDGTLVGTFGDAARAYAEFYTGSNATNPNAANAVLKLRQSNSTGRSLNASGTINASGADYAEWVPWEADMPEAGTVVRYKGSYMVVSSSQTAAFTGNDLYGEGRAILLAFMGQVPVKLRGPVRQGDYVVPNGDGTASAVGRASASFAQYREALGTAWESNDSQELKTVLVAVGVK